MASTKAKGTTKNGRDSRSKRLGLKLSGGQAAKRGMIIIRQRGSKYYVGQNVAKAGDDSLYALLDGIVEFQSKKVRNYAGNLTSKVFVHVRAK